MPYGKAVVRGHVPRAETRPAERRFYHGSVLYQARYVAVIDQPLIYGLAGRVNVERKFAVRQRRAFQNFRRRGHVFVHAARAARDHALIDVYLSVFYFIRHSELALAAEQSAALFLHFFEDFVCVFLKFAYRVGVAGVKGQGDHRLHFAQIDRDARVVIRALFGMQFLKGFLSAVAGEVFFHPAVRFPDRGKAGRFRGHHVYAVSEIHGERFYARADELHDLVFDETVFENRLDEGERHVVRAYAPFQAAFEVNRHDLGHVYVVSLSEQLLDEFGAALTHRHGADGAVTGVGIGPQDHGAAERALFAHVLMYDRDVRRHVRPAVFFGRGKAEHVIVFVDGAAHRAQGIVAVGHGVRQREFLQPAGLRRLYDADVSDVVRGDLVEFYLQFPVVSRNVVRRENFIRHRPRGGRFVRRRSLNEFSAPVNAGPIEQFYHDIFSVMSIFTHYTLKAPLLASAKKRKIF